MKEPMRHRIRHAGAVALGIFFFLIPFSKAAVELSFPLLLILWLRGWGRPFSSEALRRIPDSSRRLFLLLGLYLAVCAASIFYSHNPALSLRGFIAKTLEYALLFYIAADLADQPAVSLKVVRALLAAGGLVVLYGLLQEGAIRSAMYQAQAVDPIRGRPLDYVRMVGPYENPNDLATFLMVTGLIAVGAILRPAGACPRPVCFILAALLIGGLIWTQSMGAILGLWGGLALLGVIHRKRERLVAGLGGTIAAAGVVFILLSPNSLLEMITLSDIAGRDRASMWVTAWRMIAERPLLGHGLNTFMANYSRYAPDVSRNPAYAHNCLLQVTAETGLVGLTFFLLFLGGLARLLWTALSRPPSPPETRQPGLRAALEGVSAALVGFLIQSMFDTNFYALRQAVLFWTLAGAAVGMSVRLLRLETAA